MFPQSAAFYKIKRKETIKRRQRITPVVAKNGHGRNYGTPTGKIDSNKGKRANVKANIRHDEISSSQLETVQYRVSTTLGLWIYANKIECVSVCE
jgi:hypothetical protein